MYPNPQIDEIPSGWNMDPKPGHRKFANWLVETVKPDVIVDLGVDLGYSTFSFAEVGIGHVYGIDSFEGDEDVGPRNTESFVREFQKKYNIQNLTLIKGYFEAVAKLWTKPVDILHIDGLHRFYAVKNDFDSWAKFLKPNSVILFHDICSFEGVREFFNQLDMPKLWFRQSAGLGIACNDRDLLSRMQINFPYINQGIVT